MLLDTDAVTVVSARRTARPRSGAQQINGWDCVEVVLLRQGCFSYRDSRGRAFVDPTTCLLVPPGQDGELTHASPDGDLESMLFLCTPVIAAVGAGSGQVPMAVGVGVRCT